jgi:hypothetical protein
MRKIIAITADTVPTRYVTELQKRFDGKFTVVTSENKNEAKDFGTQSVATASIGSFFNPFDRVYTPRQIMVAQPAPIADGFFNQERKIS